MRCPKCDYLGFEDVARCRNCGYDFSLSPSLGLPDLSIRDAGRAEVGLLDDLTLADPRDLASSQDVLRKAAARPHEAGSAASAAPSDELPLFGMAAPEDAPLIARPSRPRQPLAVRRSTPEVPRLRTEARPGLLDLPLPEAPAPRPSPPPLATSASANRSDRVDETRVTPGGAEASSVGRRAAATAIDLVVLAGIDVVVIYFTMKISGLVPADLYLLPWRPLLAYLALQDATYFIALTAGGQTLGKMSTGIRVIARGTGQAPDLAHAALRTLVWLVLAAPAGLGLLSVLFDQDHRGLHDRLSGTRVVRAGL